VILVESAAPVVFGDDESIGREEGAAVAAEQAEGENVLVVGGVRRVEEDEAGGAAGFEEAGKRGGDAAWLEGVAAANAERGEVGANGAEGRLGLLDEDGFTGAAAEGLDADSAGAGIEIEKERAGDAGREDVEESLAEAVAGGADVEAAGRMEHAGAELSGDNAHGGHRIR